MNAQTETPQGQTWHSIQQELARGRMTPQGRRRLGWNVLRGVCTFLTLGGLAGVIAYVWQGFETPAETLAPVVNADPLREVVVLTDGVLTKDWVLERLALPERIALVAVDLDAVRAALVVEGQVRTAVIARDFPGTLVVTLEERVPVVRVMVPQGAGRSPQPMFVARDGFVYRGYGYDPQMVATLPWLDGIRLSRRASGLDPIRGMERVADLMLAVYQDAPHLARSIRIVSLAEAPRLVVRTPDVREVVFQPGDYRRQLARFDYILDYCRKDPGQPLMTRVDLSIPAQVAVKFAGATAASPSPFNRNSPTHPNSRGIQR